MIPADAAVPDFRVEINGRGLAPELSRHVTEVAVTLETDTSDEFAVTFANPYPDLRWTHGRAEAALLALRNRVAVEMGYVDDRRRLIEGEIAAVEPNFPDSGVPTVQVRGHSGLHALSGAERTRTFRDVTDKDVVELLAGEHGLAADVADAAAGTRHAYLIQANQTDLAFLRGRAALIGFGLRVEGSRLILRPARAEGPRAASLTWGRDLTTFSARLDAGEEVSEVVVRGYDVAGKAAIVERAGGGGAGRVATRVDLPVGSAEEARQHARALYEEAKRRRLTASGSSVGVPDLRPGRTLELLGLGPTFSGLYAITAATHRIGESGYRTEFSLRREPDR